MMPIDDLIPSEIERIAVGQVLYSHEVIVQAARQLKPEHFGDGPCRTVYATCLEMWRQGKGIDLLTVTVDLKRQGLLENVGGAYFLSSCMYRVAQTVNFDDHAEIIREYYGLRTLRKAGHQLTTGAVDGADPSELLGMLSVDVGKASMSDVSGDVNGAEVAFNLMNSTDKPKPIYLQIANLDNLVFIMPDNVVTIKGMAGSGKTAAVLSAVMNLLPIVKPWIVSIEMSAKELMMRALCQLAEVDIDAALRDQLEPEERERLARAATLNGDMLSRISIEDSGHMNIDVFRAQAQHKVQNEGVGLIVIDYAQLMDATTGKGDNSTKELELISKGIRATARTLKVPILCIVHVNKLGDEHGSIQFEKDAHVRLSISREQGSDMMTVDVLKNRNGRTGPISTPCKMQYGMVGRVTPPYWAKSLRSTPPDQFTEPNF